MRVWKRWSLAGERGLARTAQPMVSTGAGTRERIAEIRSYCWG